MANLISAEVITSKIFVIRGKKVMLDRDLAFLYGVTTKRLNEQVKRNIKRFPEDFMFRGAFTQLRRMLLTNRNLKRRIEEMERKYDKQFAMVFQAIKQLLEPPPTKEKRIIGFRVHNK